MAVHRPRLLGHAITVTLVLASLVAVSSSRARAADAPRCNGSTELCDVRLDRVAFATTHNSMASVAYRTVPPNQRRSIPAQLRHGIRGFQIDAYEGSRAGRLVFTDLAGRFGPGSDVPASVFRQGQRLHERVGAPPAGTPTDVYLCHVFCELGAVRAVDTFHAMRAFLDAHPDDAIVLVVEDYVTPDRLRSVFDEARLTPMLLPLGPGDALPTLGEMVRSGHRVVVTLENGDGGLTMPNAFSGVVTETPYNFRNERALRAIPSCDANRGTPAGEIFQLNHWVTPASSRAAARVNRRAFLDERIARCAVLRGRGPTLVAVDFAERGDVLAVVDRLNRRAAHV